MKRLLIVFFCFQIVAGSCQKPPLPDPPKPPSTKYPTNLEVVWLAPWCLDSAGGDWIWNFQVADEQYIVVANVYDRDGKRPRGVGVYNMQTGQRHSAWQNDPGGIFGTSEREDLADCKVAGKNNEVILIYNYFNLFAYNVHSGERMWSFTVPMNKAGEPKMSAKGDYAFICYGPTGAFSNSWFRLIMVNIYSGEKRDVLELHMADNYEFSINPPSAYTSDNGDTLLYFTTDGGNFETNHGSGNAYCYNLTKKQMVWINKYFVSDMSASAFDPPPFVIENDKLIITTRKAIHCLNKNTGELVWKREGLGLADRPPLYYKGRLYIRSGDPCTLFCLDAQTGQQIWENTVIDPIPAPWGRMAVYKDRLYFSAWGYNATHHLACVDIETGRELWRDCGPFGNIAFDVLIDEKTGYLYCYTGWATMCVDLNKTPKK
jgi:outer membrane protein assembly factor BamB